MTRFEQFTLFDANSDLFGNFLNIEISENQADRLLALLGGALSEIWAGYDTDMGATDTDPFAVPGLAEALYAGSRAILEDQLGDEIELRPDSASENPESVAALEVARRWTEMAAGGENVAQAAAAAMARVEGSGFQNAVLSLSFLGPVFDVLVHSAGQPFGAPRAAMAAPLPAGQPTVLGVADDRFVTTDGGDNVVSAGGGDDTAVGAAGDDILDGDGDDDVLIGGDGSDTLIGGPGNNRMTGGAGPDIFVIDAADTPDSGAMTDTITDFASGQDRVELIGFTGLASFADLTWTTTADGLVLNLPGSRLLTFSGIASQSALAEGDFVFATEGRDVDTGATSMRQLTDSDDRFVSGGTGGNESVLAGAGDDAVVTGDGNDVIDGGDGDDLILSGAGDDEVRVGGGNNRVTLGAGNDLLILRSDDNPDGGFIANELTDYVAGETTIRLIGFEGVGGFDDLVFSTVASGLAINLGNNRYLTLTGVSETALEASDFQFGEPQTNPPQIVSAGLKADTGISATDGITMDPTISGRVTDDETLATFQLRFGADGDFLDIVDRLEADGSFELDRSALETLVGNSIADGRYDVTLRAVDSDDQQTDRSFAFTLDTMIDAVARVGLAASSDTGTIGDAITSLRAVKLVGTAEPGATVSDGTVSTIVAVDGSFALNGVDVAEGSNTINLVMTDKAGNTTATSLEITGIEATGGSPVLTWNEIALEGIADNAAAPTEASRVLAMQSVAVFDVIAAFDGTSPYLVAGDVDDGASLDAAIAMASYTVLKYAFPAFEAALDAYLAEALAAVTDDTARSAGEALGEKIGNGLIAVRDADGWDDFETRESSNEVGVWRETGPMFNVAADPQWATMETWSLNGTDQFRAPALPDLGSADYAAAVNEVKAIGSAISSTRTTDQSLAARFWKDGLGSETTPGHWNSIATDYLTGKGLGAGEEAKALAILNVAVADAMIAAWDTKYVYNFWRPENAIQRAGEDGNAATIADPDWKPFMVSPSHPEYVSGHGAASGAAAEVLTDLFGTQSFTTSSTGLDGVDRSFESYWEAAQENADSRLWAGVHFDFSNQAGLELGRQVGDWAAIAFSNSQDSKAPTILVKAVLIYDSTEPFTLDGSVLDVLSGVAGLSASVNGADPVAVDFDQNGAFSFVLNDPADGTYKVAFTAIDGAGNTSAPVTSTLIVDTLDPTVTLTGLDEDGTLDGAVGRLAGSVNGTGTPIVALAYRIDDGKMQQVTFQQGTGAFDVALTLAEVTAGDHEITLIAADAAGNTLTRTIPLSLETEIPFVVVQSLPMRGAKDIGSTFRPEIHFSRPVDAATLTPESFYLTNSQGNRIDAQVKLSADGLKAWLFPAKAMPGATKITVNLDGETIKSKDGTALDGDANGEAGGDFALRFTTVSTAPVANTTISGFLVDPGKDLKPMTVDDYSAGDDGVDFTADDVFKSPITGATIYILGLEQFKVLTDENGFFELTNVPAGNVKVAVDGRTATNAPDGIFWPEMVMDATIIAGQKNTLMAAQGPAEERLAVQGRGEVYLPRVPTDSLFDVSETEQTEIGMTVDSAQDLTAEQRGQVELIVQPGSVVDEFGNPVTGAKVGISTVPPELVMDMLPAGIMQHTFDLTIQAPDAAVFTTPAQLTLPNVFDAAPGTKLNLLSFDHTTGRLVIEGTATVSADGKTVVTDPDTGITKPGWHGLTPPGGNGCDGGGPIGPDENDPNVPDPEDADVTTMPLYNNDGEGGTRFTREWMAPEPLDETPPDNSDDDCPAPAEDVDGKEQPWINVKIAIDGALADFAKKTGNLDLVSQEFTLRAGTDAKRGFAYEMKSFVEMFGAGGIKNVDMNQLYGSKITITVREQLADGSQTVTKEEIFASRFIDATDDMHTGGTGGGEMAFAQTVNDGAGNSVRDLPLEIKGLAPDIAIGTGTHFSLQNGNSVVRFDPTSTSGSLTDTLGVSFASQGGGDAGSISLKGEGNAPETYKFDTTTYHAILTSLLNATNYPNVTATQKALIDTEAKRDALLTGLAGKTQDFFDDAGLKGISQTTTATNTHDVSFLDGRGQITYKADGSVDSYGLGGATNAFSETDIDFDEIIKLYQDRAKYNSYELAYRTGEKINNTNGGSIAFYLDNFFINVGDSDSKTELEFSLGHNSAHEIGHYLGLLHTFQWGIGLLHPGGRTDVMAQGVYPSATQSFAKTLEAVKVALHNSYTPAEVVKALAYYNTLNTTSAGYVTNINNSFGDIGESDIGGNPFFIVQAPSLDIRVVEGDAIHDQLDFGEATVGSDPVVIELAIQNYGAEIAKITKLVSTNTAFTLSSDDRAFELQPGQIRYVEVAFDPMAAGDASGFLSITSNSTEVPIEIALSGESFASGPLMQVTSENSNIGGVDRNETESLPEMFTVVNQGREDLVIDAISIATLAGAFELVGLPENFDTTPITLGKGESFRFGASFTGIGPGLAHAPITISSNDPTQPVVTVAAMATSFDDIYAFDWGNDFLAIDIAGNTIRTTTNDDGSFELFLPPEEDYKITIFDPDSGLVSMGFGTTAPSGQGTDLASSLVFLPSVDKDSDFDGLSDDIEHAIGTGRLNKDTDGDGTSDLDEVLNGLDPLGGFPTTTGVIETIGLGSQVTEIVMTADLPAIATLAIVTSDDGTVSFLDIQGRTSVSLLAQIDVGNNAKDVGLDAGLGRAAVATGSDIKILDISDPEAPTVSTSINLSASLVEVANGRVFAAERGTVYAFDLLTGIELQSIGLTSGASAIRAMSLESGRLYVVDSSQRLTVLELDNDALREVGSLDLSGEAWARSVRSDKIFVSDDVLYIPTDQGFNAGYATVDITDPAAMAVISGPDDRAISGTDFADAGNGIGLAVGAIGGVFGTNSIMVVDTSDPAVTDAFISRFDLDAAPTVVNASAGFAYVGDAAGDFHIVNALGFDMEGIAPVVTFDAPAIDADPETDGIQLEEGRFVQLPVSVTDDKQVQKVELLLNGEVIRTDLSVPYSMQLQVPTLASGATGGTLQVRATDTGGNVGLSGAVRFGIIEDNTAPELVSISPPDQGLALPDRIAARVLFNESVDPASVTAGLVTLTNGDGQQIAASDVVMIAQDRIAQFLFDDQALGSYTLRLDLAGITDVAGNPLGGDEIVRALDVVDATAVWGSGTGGVWSEASNWRDGTLPGATDKVAIVLDDGEAVTFSGPETRVDEISLSGDLTLQGNRLEAGTIFGSAGQLRQTGGTLANTTIGGNDSFSVSVAFGTWSNVNLNTEAVLPAADFAQLYVADGLTVNGRLDAQGGERYSYIYLLGEQTIDGSGEIALSGDNSYLYFDNLDSTLREDVVIAEGLTLSGSGLIYAERNDDRIQILGDVFGDGGVLRIQDVDNKGERLTASSSDTGAVEFQDRSENILLNVLAGADVRVNGGTHTGMEIQGPGTARLGGSARMTDMTVTGMASVEALVADRSDYLYIEGGLVVDGTLKIASLDGHSSYLYMNGGQTIAGTGEIVFSRDNAGDEGVTNNNLQLLNTDSGVSERLIFGADLTLRGEGNLGTNRNEDRLQILGLVKGENGGLTLNHVHNDGEVMTVDASMGGVTLGSRLDDTVVRGFAPADDAGFDPGHVRIGNGSQIRDVTFDMDARLGAPGAYETASVFQGLTINGALQVASGEDRYAYLYAYGEQTIDGNGRLSLSDLNANGGNFANFVQLQGLTGEVEVLTFGSGLTIEGGGVFSASSGEDNIRILGTVRGDASGAALELHDIDNGGATLTVDASLGSVRIGSLASETVFAAAEGQTGALGFVSGSTLDRSILNINANFGNATDYQTMNVQNGLTLNRDFTVQTGEDRYSYVYFQGEQVLDGTGRILLSDVNAPDANTLQNRIDFNGVQGGVSETFTVGADIAIIGEGYVEGSAEDRILVEGSIQADNGQLRASFLEDLEGTLGASDDGVLVLDRGVTLTERSILQVSMSGSGAEAQSGRIQVTGQLEQRGTLELMLADGFDAALGAEFDIVTATTGFSQSFDDYQGFRISDDKAFEIYERDGNTLVARVVTAAVAQSRGFINRDPFVPGDRPAEGRSDLAIDEITGVLQDVRITGRETGDGPVGIAGGTMANVELDADVSGVAGSSVGSLRIYQGLELGESTMSFANSSVTGGYQLDFYGTQTVSGVGVLDFMRNAQGTSGQHSLFLRNVLAGEEILTLGEDITLRGHVDARGAGNGIIDNLRILGTVEGVAGAVTSIGNIDNGGQVVSVDASEGRVELTHAVRNTDFQAVADTTGHLELGSLNVLSNVTFGMDAVLSDSTSNRTIFVHKGLELQDATLRLEGWGQTALLDFLGTQSVTGTGTIDLLADPAGDSRNILRLNGLQEGAETLTFGEGITLRGTGKIEVYDTRDSISILGTVVADGGAIELANVDNDGASFIADASGGQIELAGLLAETTILAADGNTGMLGLSGATYLRDVEIGIDAEMNTPLSSATMRVEDGLTLRDAALTLSGSERATAQMEFRGAQTLGGTGQVIFSDRLSIDGRSVNNIMSFRGNSTAVETFGISSGLTFMGYGDVMVTDGDVLDFDGDIIAEGGIFHFQGLGTFDGSMQVHDLAGIALQQTVVFSDSTDLSVQLAGGGLNASAGMVSVTGMMSRDGTFRFDIADDFDAAIGAEFLVATASDGFNGAFDAIADFGIDDARGLALIEDDNNLYARVVAAAEAGAQYDRLDYRNITPNTRNGDQTDVTLGTGWAGGASALVTSGNWSNVVLDVEAVLPAQTYAQLDVSGGLTVNGTLSVLGGTTSSYVYFRGGQTVDGTGEIVMDGTNANLYLIGQDNAVREDLVLGADLLLRGNGFVYAQQNQDFVQILADVIGDGGTLHFQRVDNKGETLSVSTSEDGIVQFESQSENVVLNVASGADVRVNSGTHTAMDIQGPGSGRLSGFAVFSGLTVTGMAEVEALTENASAYVSMAGGLTVNGILKISGTESRTATVYMQGPQTIGGTGEIVMSRENALTDAAVPNRIELQSQDSAEAEVLVIGADLTLSGDGIVTTNRGEDSVQVLGLVKGAEGGLLTLTRVNNQGEALIVDASAGAVGLDARIDNAVVQGFVPEAGEGEPPVAFDPGFVRLLGGVEIRTVTFDMDARLGLPGRYEVASLYEGLEVNAMFELAAGENQYADFNVYGGQTIAGTGVISLSGVNANGGPYNNRITLQSQSDEAEVLTFAAGLTIEGGGLLQTNRTEDSIQILGTVKGNDAASPLVLNDLNNQGETVTVDATMGSVRIGDRATDTVFAAAAGQTGKLELQGSATLDGVTLDIDAVLGDAVGYYTATVQNGLTLNQDFTIGTGEGRYAYLYFQGEQTLDGTGRILLSDSNAPDFNELQNWIQFNGTDGAVSETFTIGSDIEIVGEGNISSNGAADVILVQGMIMGDDGQLRVRNLDAVQGTLASSDDAVLLLDRGVTLTDTATLQVGLSGAGDAARAGRIQVTGGLEQMGTLDIELAAGFDAALGDEFVIITATDGLTGAFDTFEGLNIGNGKAFEIFNPDEDTLALRVIESSSGANVQFAEDDFIF